jgi:DNA-directed RNA polymerase subunit M/transcription elongation factor TFIIS
MHFCTECSNMYYIRIDGENPNKLIYYCRHCGNEDHMISLDNVTVSKTHMKPTQQKFSNLINKYTKLDPTLPRINRIKCPNTDCGSNKEGAKEEQREIIYIRYDDVNMKYVYLCCSCDIVWKTDSME